MGTADTTVLGKVTKTAREEYQYCVDVPADFIGIYRIGVTAFVTPGSSNVVVYDFQMDSGNCKGSFVF
ncbi:hypothetical protein DPMN_170550 [Dreissena polymorpha]|uniref:Uncharacterized protein n=1 Tax=Dreissena polymorpha TaxID=45954 RepID=A0A9D4DYT6_DREPO|nr:hypothetical protein DPMN_170550 [Dreissena polymorpha]